MLTGSLVYRTYIHPVMIVNKHLLYICSSYVKSDESDILKMISLSNTIIWYNEPVLKVKSQTLTTSLKFKKELKCWVSLDGHVYSYLVCTWGKFFFSSRRRHTKLQGDWSSDVCSSDLLSSQSVTYRQDQRSPDHYRGQLIYGVLTQHLYEIGRASCRERV